MPVVFKQRCTHAVPTVMLCAVFCNSEVHSDLVTEALCFIFGQSSPARLEGFHTRNGRGVARDDDYFVKILNVVFGQKWMQSENKPKHFVSRWLGNSRYFLYLLFCPS